MNISVWHTNLNFTVPESVKNTYILSTDLTTSKLHLILKSAFYGWKKNARENFLF